MKECKSLCTCLGFGVPARTASGYAHAQEQPRYLVESTLSKMSRAPATEQLNNVHVVCITNCPRSRIEIRPTASHSNHWPWLMTFIFISRRVVVMAHADRKQNIKGQAVLKSVETKGRTRPIALPFSLMQLVTRPRGMPYSSITTAPNYPLFSNAVTNKPMNFFNQFSDRILTYTVYFLLRATKIS